MNVKTRKVGKAAVAVLLSALMVMTLLFGTMSFAKTSSKSAQEEIIKTVTSSDAAKVLRPHGSKGPIKHAAVDKTLPQYYGKPVSVVTPTKDIVVPQHPYLAAEGRNGMHGNSYNTGSYNYDAPLGKNPVVTSQSFNSIGGEVANVQFDSKGRIIAISGGFAGFRLLLLDPDTLEILAEYDLPQRASTVKFLQTLDFSYISEDTSGGAYFTLLKGDRPILGNSENVIQIFKVDDSGKLPQWKVEKEYDLSEALPEGSYISAVIPDFDGNYWFVTRFGQVGYVEPKTGKSHIITLKKEEIQNAFATDKDGVYIVSDYAQYKFVIGKNGKPTVSWRSEYDRGTTVKPGEINQGSGTTPTLLDVKDSNGKTHKLLGITDNADGRVNLVVYDRTNGKVVSKTPLFKDGASCSENSLIAVDRSFIIENNYSPNGAGFLVDDPRSEPGVTRVDINKDVTGAKVVWESQEASNTVVPKLSTRTGLIYLYTRIENDDIPDNVVAWYVTAIDYKTGKTKFRVFTGTGKSWNNSYAPIVIGPNGTLYVGTFNGLVSVKDRK